MNIGDIFGILHYPIQWALVELTKIFNAVPPVAAVGAYGLAIVVVTIVIRFCLFPIFGWQLRNTRRIQEEQRILQTQMQEIRKKYAKDRVKLSQEMQKLYAEHGVSPLSSLSGCLPLLVQMPVL